MDSHNPSSCCPCVLDEETEVQNTSVMEYRLKNKREIIWKRKVLELGSA